MSEREEPGLPAMALQMASIIRRHAKTHGFTRVERLTAYNLLLVDTLFEQPVNEEMIQEAVKAFERSIRLEYDTIQSDDTTPGVE